MAYFHQVSATHMQGVVVGDNTIATKLGSKAAGQPVDLRVGQSRGDLSTLEVFLARVAVDAAHGLLVTEFDFISSSVIKQFTKSVVFAQVQCIVRARNHVRPLAIETHPSEFELDFFQMKKALWTRGQ